MATSDIRFDAPTPFYKALVFWILKGRRLSHPELLRKRTISDTSDPITGRFGYKDYQAHPFYVKPTFWNRWCPEALFVRLSGGTVPGSDGTTYAPEGYMFEEVGPARSRARDLDKVIGIVANL